MRYIKPFALTIVLLGLSFTASAQQAATGPAQAGIPAAIPKGKIAIINTTVFPGAILELKSKIEALERQFEPRTKEVQGLAERAQALETTIKTQESTLTAARVAEMTEQLGLMKREYQRKVEDLQTEAGRAQNQILAPFQQKLGKFTEQYTAKHGITVMIDIAKAVETNTVLWVDPRMDITRDFVDEYNKANPVAGAPPASAPTNPPPAAKKPSGN